MLSRDTIMRTKRYMTIVIMLLILVVVFSVAISSKRIEDDVSRGTIETKDEPAAYDEERDKNYYDGEASWYDYSLDHEDQRCTKDREPCYSQRALTCASRDYPKGSILEVSRYSEDEWENKDGSPSGFFIPTTVTIKCRVNDYGPEESTGRIIDLSSYAFSKLASLKLGVIQVTVQEVK